MYTPIAKTEIADQLMHLRDLFRAVRPLDAEALRAHEKRETVTKNLLSNLGRTKDHPTLRTVLDVAEIFSLTLDGAHSLFGYDLDAIRDFDLEFNGGRTHIMESYSFYRDLRIDLPLRLGARELFASRSWLRDLVPEWQTGLPIRALEKPGWHHPGAFYVHVGTEDSLGSSLPANATALVIPISKEEERRPNPRGIYLLQFGNGYRCSQCVATGGKLLLLASGRHYFGPQEFAYPGHVRIVGRIRMFGLSLPSPEYPKLGPLPTSSQSAPLILPWEHASRDRLFWTKHRRFTRPPQERREVQASLHALFGSRPSDRTERRYRGPSESQPHIDTLIQMAIVHATRYSDALRADQSLPSDRGRFSLETLLRAQSLSEVFQPARSAHPPQPRDLWEELRDAYHEWPMPLAMRFPRLRSFDDRIVRLPQGASIQGMLPPIQPGSILFLEGTSLTHDAVTDDAQRTGWNRSIYALRKGAEVVCGYLRQDHAGYTLSDTPHGATRSVTLGINEIGLLTRVGGIAVPV